MTNDSIKLGVMPPLSGLVEIYGSEISNAAKVACQEINENGGVLGRELELVFEDDGSLPESSVTAAEKLIDEHQCSAIVGNLLSNSRIAVAYRVAEPRKIPYLNFSFYEGSILSRYFFHFAALPNQQIERMIPYMREHFGPKMFFAGNNYEWPRGSIHAAKQALESVGGMVVGEEYCPIGVDADTIERLLDQVEKANPDVFVPYFAGNDQVLLLTRFTEKSLKSKMAVVMGHYDEMMASKLSPEVREGFFSSNTYFMTIDTKENKNYLERLKKLSGISGIWPQGNGILTNFGEGTYICVKAFAEAANLAGSVDPEKLLDALKEIKISSPQGLVEMRPENQHARVNTYLSQCQKDGSFKIIEEFGAIEPILPNRYNHQRINYQATMEDDIRLQARMLEQMTEAVLLINLADESIVYSNACAERMFGYGQGELSNHGILELGLKNHESANSLAEIIQILQQKGKWKGEIQLQRNDNTPVWCSVSISTFTHPAYLEVWLFVANDITESKEIDTTLRESEARYRRAERGTNDGLWEWNINTGENYFSPRWFKMLGYEPEELPYHVDTFNNLVHPDDIESVLEAVQHHLDAGLTYDIEIRMKHKDAHYIWVRTRGHAVRDVKGNPFIMTGSITDITEHKVAQYEILKHREHLEELVQERTRELTLARDAAEHANAAKSEFLSCMSHELRTPLNAILGFGQLLEINVENPLDKNQAESVHEILEAGKHLLKLVKEILDLSRIESGKLDLQTESVNIIPIIESCISQVTPLAAQRNITITLESGDPGLVQSDKMRLTQILLNLVSNAIKYNCENGTVNIYCSAENQKYLRISIEDTGKGIAADKMPHLFKPFERLEDNYSGIDGTGIGLAMAKKLVDAMNGKISVESTPDQGSIFWFELPLSKKPRKKGKKGVSTL